MSTDPNHAGDERIDLVILFGGQSAEHDVSCVSAAHVMRAADPGRYRVVPVGISRDGGWSLATAAQAALATGSAALPTRLEAGGEAMSPVELLGGTGTTVVLPLLHGPMGEDGTVQGLLELLGVPYVGSGVLGSAVGMDKGIAKQLLAAAGIAQARFRAVRDADVSSDLAAELATDLGLPLFVKPANMGSSVGVSKARTVEEVAAAVDLALTYDEWVVIEEAITGREIEVAVLGNVDPRASVPGEIVPGAEFYDYADKYETDSARTVVPAALGPADSEAVRALAVQVFRVLRGDGLARVDFFFEEGGRGFLVNEVNTMPGFTPISMYPKLWIASGVSYAELIDELVRLAIDRHARRRWNTKH
jgi:D-alanine--D-alanine ligase